MSSSSTGNFVTDLIAAQIVAGTVYTTGKVVSTPALLVTDGTGLVYACDVDIGLLNTDGSPALLRNVPIAAGFGVVYYAQQGTAVNLTRSASGQYRITGMSATQPGTYVRIPVNVKTAQFGAPVDYSLTIAPIPLGSLQFYGGGFGVIPLGSSALYQGTTFIEVIPLGGGGVVPAPGSGVGPIVPPTIPTPPTPPLPPTSTVPAAAAAVGFNLKTFDSTKLGSTAGTLQKFNFFGNVVPDNGTEQNSDGSLTLTGYSGNPYGATVALAAYNPGNLPNKIQGIAFNGGYLLRVVASFSGTQAGDAMAIWANDAEHMSDVLVDIDGVQWTEHDYFEWNVVGSLTQLGTSLHSDYWQSGAAGQANPPAITSPVTTSGDFGSPHTYDALWVPATPSTQGYLKIYRDDVQLGTTVYWDLYSGGESVPPTGFDIGNVTDTRHMVPIIGSSNPATPMTLYSVQVWQDSAANNWVF